MDFLCKSSPKFLTSALAKNKHYKQIINMLAVKKFATREEIATHLYSLAPASNLARYTIKDQYLQFYYKYIAPIINKIKHGDFNDDPVKAINVDAYNKWQGFA